MWAFVRFPPRSGAAGVLSGGQVSGNLRASARAHVQDDAFPVSGVVLALLRRLSSEVILVRAVCCGYLGGNIDAVCVIVSNITGAVV